MKELIGKITAALAEKEGLPPEHLVERINLNINPPEKVSAENIYIRAMYIVSDKVNSFGGKFPVEEQARLLPLLSDTPVLVGHRKDSLPIARNFHAEMIEKDNTHWIKAYFYWLKNAEGAESLKNNIDGGIYRECSISFIFAFPECSLCGSDIRRCGHRPLQKYRIEGVEQEASFNYRRIEKVLETSLVYRGAVPDTSLTNELLLFSGDSLKDIPVPPLSPRNRIWDLGRFQTGQRFLAGPAYESLRVIFEKEAADIRLYDARAREISSPRIIEYLKGLSLPSGNFMAEGRLLGFRGKERRPVGEIVSLLRGEKTNIRRLEIKFSKLVSREGCNPDSETVLSRRQHLEKLFADHESLLLPAVIASPDNRGHILTRLMTRLGLEITDLDDGQEYLYSPSRCLALRIRSSKIKKGGFIYDLEAAEGSPETDSVISVFSVQRYKAGDVIELEFPPEALVRSQGKFPSGRIIDYWSDHELPDRFDMRTELPAGTKTDGDTFDLIDNSTFLISLSDNNSPRSFTIADFSAETLASGRRFLVEDAGSRRGFNNHCLSNKIVRQERRGNTLCLELTGTITGRYVLRPAVINGRNNFLFYRVEPILPREVPYES